MSEVVSTNRKIKSNNQFRKSQLIGKINKNIRKQIRNKSRFR